MSRIIFVTRCFNTDFNTGGARTVSDIAFGLSNSNWEVHLIVGQQGYQHSKDKLKDRIISGVQIHRLWNVNFPITSAFRRALHVLIFHLSCAFTLLRLLKKGDIVVATTDPPLISVVIAFITRLRGAIQINWILDIYPELAERLGFRLARGWHSSILRYLCNLSWKFAIYNLVLGERMAEFVYKQGITKNKVLIFPNWEDGELVRPKLINNSNSFRIECQIENKFVIGYFGNMGRAYDFETIMDCATHLSKINAEVTFLFVGNGYYKNFLEINTINNKLKNLICKPYQPPDKLSETFAAANIHIISMRQNLEGLLVPGKLYSAMAAGRPIIFIGSEDGEVARLLRKFKCGTTVQMNDHLALTKTILEYHKNNELCEQEGHNARVAFENYYNKNIAIRRWNELLESIN
jgi:glycosyltransferase involved in cell wall biosynthesis